MTYISIVHEYNSRRRRISWISIPERKTSSIRKQKGNSKRTEFKKQYTVPILLIFTFILFMAIPDLIFLFVVVINENPSETLRNICLMSYGISNLVDVIIYVCFLGD